MERWNVEAIDAHLPQNVGALERWLSLAAGSALVAWGLTQRTKGSPALLALGGALAFRGATGRCPIYKAAGFSTFDEETDDVAVEYGKGVQFTHSVVLDAQPESLYAFWRKLENLPRFMEHLESVTELDSKRSHWVAKGPAHSRIEWDAEIINEIPNELIGWRTINDPAVDHAGSVHFERLPSRGGTRLSVVLRYDPPGGKAGALVARLLGEDPDLQIANDLRRFQALVEAGEIAAIEQPSGRSRDGR